MDCKPSVQIESESFANLAFQVDWITSEERYQATSFRVNDSRMCPQIQPTSGVLGVLVQNYACAERVVVVAIRGKGCLIGRIEKGGISPERETFVLKADNPDYPPLTIAVKEVERVFQVRAFFDSPVD